MDGPMDLFSWIPIVLGKRERSQLILHTWSVFISTDHCLGGVVGSDGKSYNQPISVGVLLLFLRFVSSIYID